MENPFQPSGGLKKDRTKEQKSILMILHLFLAKKARNHRTLATKLQEKEPVEER